MKQGIQQSIGNRGSTLIEAVIAIGVFAAALPLVVSAMDESGNSRCDSGAETRCAWVIPACVDEVLASRSGRSRYLPHTIEGVSFPPDEDVWALAFSGEGELIGRLSGAHYRTGVRKLDDREIRYIATVRASRVDAAFRLRISVEYPAAAPAGKRGKLDSYTMIP
jgi:hypothetical protein